MTGTEERRISSLHDLPQEIAPARDLWQGIEARIIGEQGAVVERGARPRAGRVARLRIFAAAAVIAALAVGIWIGRAMLPVPAGPVERTGVTVYEPGAWRAEYVMDSRYTRERAVLLQGLEARLAALPPESRTKVVASLRTLAESKRNLEAELGKDPSNALLQELLVNTCQDEMRVLTTVHEAGSTGEGI